MVPLAKMVIYHGASQQTCNTSSRSQWIQPLIMGRKTWDSLPEYCQEEGMSYYQEERVEGVEVVSFDQALGMEGWIIGGGQIYELFLPHVNQLHRTIIDTRVMVLTHFPRHYCKERHVSAGERDQHDMVFQHWVR